MQSTTSGAGPRPKPPAADQNPQQLRARLLELILKNEAQRKAPPS